MALSASIFQTLVLLEHVEVQQGLNLRLLPLFLPASSFFAAPELVILHKLLVIFTINLVCYHCHLFHNPARSWNV